MQYKEALFGPLKASSPRFGKHAVFIGKLPWAVHFQILFANQIYCTARSAVRRCFSTSCSPQVVVHNLWSPQATEVRRVVAERRALLVAMRSCVTHTVWGLIRSVLSNLNAASVSCGHCYRMLWDSHTGIPSPRSPQHRGPLGQAQWDPDWAYTVCVYNNIRKMPTPLSNTPIRQHGPVIVGNHWEMPMQLSGLTDT